MYATLREEGPGQQAVLIIDQTELPLRAVERRLGSLAEVADAIRSMQVRGAPLIGASAAYGVALAMNAASSDEALADALACLAATRPTAVNLHWALARMRQHLLPLSAAARAAAAWQEARRIRPRKTPPPTPPSASMACPCCRRLPHARGVCVS